MSKKIYHTKGYWESNPTLSSFQLTPIFGRVEDSTFLGTGEKQKTNLKLHEMIELKKKLSELDVKPTKKKGKNIISVL